MSRSSPIQTAFNSGEISPLLYGREDYARWNTGLRTCNGFLPLRQGGVTRAPGTTYRGTTRSNSRAKLLRFEFAVDDSLILELTANKMRVWRYSSLVMKDGAAYELDTPYDEAALDRLQWTQSADVIYMVDGVLPPQRLARFALDDWSIGDLELTDGPYRIGNVDKDITVQVTTDDSNGDPLGTGIVGEQVELIGTGSPFRTDMVDTMMQVEPYQYPDIQIFTTNTTVGEGGLVRSDGNIYRLVGDTERTDSPASWQTGLVPPSHLEGRDRTDEHRTFEFVSDGRGVVRITDVLTADHAIAAVVRDIPPPIITAPTYRFAEQSWSPAYGYPAAIEIYEQRLVLAGTSADPRTIWFSAVGSYSEFAGGGEADDPFAYAVAGSQSLNRIIWMTSGTRGLHVGALGNEFSVRSETAGQAIGPTSFELGMDASVGSHPVRPIAPDGKPIFIAKDQRRVFEMRYAFDADANMPVDLSLSAEHLGRRLFEDITWQDGQQRMAWLRMGDGTLTAMVHDPQEEVLGWAPYSVAGGHVESLSTYPDPATGRDIVLMVVRREIDGVTVRSVERQAGIFGLQDRPPTRAVHLFCALGFNPAELEATFSVPHLVGQQVFAWTEQGSFGPLTVDAAGGVTLPAAVDYALIGLLDETHEVETLPIRAVARDGDTTGRQRRLFPSGGIRVHQTSGGEVAVMERDVERGAARGDFAKILPETIGSEDQDLYSGVIELQQGSGYAREVSYIFRPEGGAPLTLLTVTPMVEWGGG